MEATYAMTCGYCGGSGEVLHRTTDVHDWGDTYATEYDYETEPCERCEGEGYVETKDAICMECAEWIVEGQETKTHPAGYTIHANCEDA